jgi:hypothetical protein
MLGRVGGPRGAQNLKAAPASGIPEATMPTVAAIPENLLVNWRAWWPGDAESVATDILARLAEAVDAWALTDVTLLPGGEAALVLAATSPQGEAVLKLNPRLAGRTDELAGEARALAIWANAGAAPQVHGSSRPTSNASSPAVSSPANSTQRSFEDERLRRRSRGDRGSASSPGASEPMYRKGPPAGSS